APATPILVLASPSIGRHAFVVKFLDCLFVLGKMQQPHPAQHIRRLGELYIIVADDLYTVAPRIEEIEELTGQRVHTRVRQRVADGVLVINHESKMTAVVRGLSTALLEREELIAQIDEGRGLAPAAKFEVEQATVNRQGLIDIIHLKSDMIETDGARFS